MTRKCGGPAPRYSAARVAAVLGLRRAGLSYKMVSRLCAVPKGTVLKWCNRSCRKEVQPDPSIFEALRGTIEAGCVE